MIVKVMNIKALMEPDELQRQLEQLSEMRRKKALTHQQTKARALCVGAGILLEKTLREEYALTEEEIQKLQYKEGEYGKPVLAQYPQIHFNLSHSGEYVACVVAEDTVGIDIQEMKEYREKVAKRFFSEYEKKLLDRVENQKEKKKLFYQIWTGKESYTKLLGNGLTKTMSGYSIKVYDGVIEENGKITEYKVSYPWEQDGYLCCICSKELPMQNNRATLVAL